MFGPSLNTVPARMQLTATARNMIFWQRHDQNRCLSRAPARAPAWTPATSNISSINRLISIVNISGSPGFPAFHASSVAAPSTIQVDRPPCSCRSRFVSHLCSSNPAVPKQRVSIVDLTPPSQDEEITYYKPSHLEGERAGLLGIDSRATRFELW